jgi:hypothetical protein
VPGSAKVHQEKAFPVSNFKDRDVRRLIKSAQASGLNPTAVEVDTRTGRIKVITGKAGEATTDELNNWLGQHPDAGHTQGHQS